MKRTPLLIAIALVGAASLLALKIAARGYPSGWLQALDLLFDLLVLGLVIGYFLLRRVRDDARAADMRAALTESEAQLAAVVDTAMDAIISVDREQRVVLFNRAAETMFGVARGEALGERLERFIPARFRNAHRAHIERFGGTGDTRRRMGENLVLWALRADGTEFPIEASISQTGEPHKRLFTVILRDTTQRKAAEDALRKQQEQLAAIVDTAMDAIITVDREQRIVLFNRAAETMFGVARGDALGDRLDRFIPARFRETHRGHIERFGGTGETRRRMGENLVLWALRADGSEFPIEASISQTGDPEKRLFTVILRDMTQRKAAEDALRQQQAELRELSARVLEAREEEKTIIARELHDELGQLLTALKMDLDWLREHATPGETADKVAQMNTVLDRTVGSVRRIAADLRPLMLDDLGLADAASWLVEDFMQRSGIRCKLDKSDDDALDGIERGIATTIYRALQESLTNVARHSAATNAWVLLRLDEGALRLEIEDDGRGMPPAAQTNSRSLGLKGMRERVHYHGGMLEVGHAPRGGTRVKVRVPLQPGSGAGA